MKFKTLAIAQLILLLGCNDPKELTPPRYLKWVSSAERGFIKTKIVNGVEISVRYLPSEYLAYKDYLASPELQFDSLWKEYKCATVFLVTLHANKNNSVYGNLMMYGVTSEEEFKAKTHYLSFSIEEFISMKSGEAITKPVLTHFEGYDQISNRISFYVSFIPSGYNCMEPDNTFRDVTITFKDPVWQLGTNHFLFPKSLLINSPRLKF